ncbi:hypothetical protein J8273_2135 [Carpediemonas membranifera]|uniref:Uncharacterized protein n=1 Tax=Carpediemonas membranifera TaxID=201153 RepID=A0A8J6BA29_9EUKA|nr:hypothetical protein J8273_2135 [Carpediemonas membranifera]|eukprot:KAG9396404.1 hypothetical protein J8273_2135 [Carpediemonas membranifera]
MSGWFTIPDDAPLKDKLNHLASQGKLLAEAARAFPHNVESYDSYQKSIARAKEVIGEIDDWRAARFPKLPESLQTIVGESQTAPAPVNYHAPPTTLATQARQQMTVADPDNAYPYILLHIESVDLADPSMAQRDGLYLKIFNRAANGSQIDSNFTPCAVNGRTVAFHGTQLLHVRRQTVIRPRGETFTIARLTFTIHDKDGTTKDDVLGTACLGSYALPAQQTLHPNNHISTLRVSLLDDAHDAIGTLLLQVYLCDTHENGMIQCDRVDAFRRELARLPKPAVRRNAPAQTDLAVGVDVEGDAKKAQRSAAVIAARKLQPMVESMDFDSDVESETDLTQRSDFEDDFTDSDPEEREADLDMDDLVPVQTQAAPAPTQKSPKPVGSETLEVTVTRAVGLVHLTGPAQYPETVIVRVQLVDKAGIRQEVDLGSHSAATEHGQTTWPIHGSASFHIPATDSLAVDLYQTLVEVSFLVPREPTPEFLGRAMVPLSAPTVRYSLTQGESNQGTYHVTSATRDMLAMGGRLTHPDQGQVEVVVRMSCDVPEIAVRDLFRLNLVGRSAGLPLESGSRPDPDVYYNDGDDDEEEENDEDDDDTYADSFSEAPLQESFGTIGAGPAAGLDLSGIDSSMRLSRDWQDLDLDPSQYQALMDQVG